MTADITLRGPGDVLAVLPYQLGYHPRDSVVVVSLHERQIGLVLRSDLPPDEHVAEVSGSLVGPVLRERAGSVIVIGFEEVAHRSTPMLLAVVEDLERSGVEVLDVQVVRAGRRYSPLCAQACCPPEGEPVPGPQDVPAVAEFVLRGRSPLRDRRQVDALVAPDPELVPGVADALAQRAARPGRVTDRRRRSARAWGMLLGEPGAMDDVVPSLSPHVVADLATGLADIPWRDGVIAWLAPGVLPLDVIDRHVVARLRRTMPRWGDMGAGLMADTSGRRVGWASHADVGLDTERHELMERLLGLCRAVPDSTADAAAAVCTLAASVSWSDGDGAVARAAIDRAVRLRPGYRLGYLLERVIDQGVRVGAARAGADRRTSGGRVDGLGWAG